MQDARKQPDAAACNEMLRTFTGQVNSHWKVFESSLLLEFEKHTSGLQEENETLRMQLFSGSAVTDLKGKPVYQPCFEAPEVSLDLSEVQPSKPVAIAVMPKDADPSEPAKLQSADDDSPAISAQGPSSIHELPHQIVEPATSKNSTFRCAPPPIIDNERPARVSFLFTPGPDKHCLENLVGSKKFELLSSCLILLNSVVMALQLQYDGLDVGNELEWRAYTQPAKQTWPWLKAFSAIAAIFFNALFCAELLLRVAAAGRLAFFQAWIIFDTIVVSFSVMDVVLPSGVPVNPGMMRVVRLVRLVRLLKLLKTMTAFDSLFLLLKSVKASMHAAFWSFLMLVTIQLIVGLFLSQVLLDYAKDESNSLESREEVFKYFGTFSRSMLTTFEITFANWVVSCRVLVEHVNEWFMLIFLVYRCFFCFALLKVISAVFITETNRVLEHDDELTVMKKNRDKMLLSEKVHSLIRNLAHGDSRKIGWDAFESIAQDAEMARLLVPLGFEIHDLEKLFWLLQDSSGFVQVDEFLNKVARLRGNAKSIDAQTLIKITHRIDETLHNVFHKQGYMVDEDAQQKAIEDKACSM